MRVLVPTSPSVSNTDGIIIHIINHELYGSWSGFFLFSVIGACISTANSQLLLIASSLSYDVVRSVSRRELSEKQVVSLARAGVLFGGTLAMLLTLDPPAFTLSYGGDIWGIISILFFPPLFGTLLTHKLTRKGIWACILVGVTAIALLYPMYYRGTLEAHPAMFGTPLSAAAMFLVSALDRRREGPTP